MGQSNVQISLRSLIQGIQSLVSEEKGPLYASEEDCDFFRSIYRGIKQEPEIKIGHGHVHEKQPTPAPLPKPVRETAPLSKIVPAPEIVPVCVPVPDFSKESPPRLEDHLLDVRKMLLKIAPSFAWIDTIPSDQEATRIANSWKTKTQAARISLLFLSEPPPFFKFLENLTRALDVVFGGARLLHAETIEKEKQWEAFLSVPELKYVIVCDSTLGEMPHLLQCHREVPTRSERFLQNTPLILLPDLTLYLKDPLLKRSLWKALCQKIV
jgi:hypothetical protein